MKRTLKIIAGWLYLQFLKMEDTWYDLNSHFKEFLKKDNGEGN